jgi:hypothetical protein
MTFMAGGSQGPPAISPILSALEQRLDLVVISQERDKQVCRPVQENKTQRNIAATLEKLVAQFANPQAAVDVRPTKRVGQLAERQQALDPFILGWPLQASQDGRVNRKGLSQASSSAGLR